MPIVEIPGVGQVEFPDSMTPDELSKAAALAFKGAKTVTTEDFIRPEDQNIFTQPVSTSLKQGAVGALKEIPAMISGMASGVYGAVRHPLDTITGMGAQQQELAKKSQAATNPLEKAAYGVSAALPVVGPMMAGIGERLGSGNPEQMGRAVTDVAAPMLAGPLARGARAALPAVVNMGKAATATPAGAFVAGAAENAPGSQMFRGGMARLRKQQAGAEGALLSPEAEQLRASTEVTGPATSTLDLQGTRAGGPPATPPQTPAVMGPAKMSARERAFALDEQAAADARMRNQLPPEAPATPAQAPLQHDSRAIADFMHPSARVVQDQMFQETNPVFRRMRREGALGERFVLEEQLAARAEEEMRQQMAQQGSRLTPKPSGMAVDPGADVPGFETVAPESGYGLNSPAGQAPMDLAGEGDVIEQLRLRAQAAGPQAPAAPTATYVGRSMDEFPDMYNVSGGPSNGSSLSRASLDKMGIPVPGVTKVPMGASGPLHAPGVKRFPGRLTEEELLQREALMDELMQHYNENTGY